MSYWQECIESPFEEAGITATIEQISLIPDAVRCAHENYGMAYPVPENPLINDVVSLKKSLARERPGSPAGDAKGQVAGMHPSASVIPVTSAATNATAKEDRSMKDEDRETFERKGRHHSSFFWANPSSIMTGRCFMPCPMKRSPN
ncbi:MAG TPA: hypothetical protein VHW24_00880 [Bryobacteraceae bacterium]|jgi:hypothetical protein|nr:hypothetical protein [Bryobacteraceae bacterium]